MVLILLRTPNCHIHTLYKFFISTPCINYMQYPWGYASPVNHIISTREPYHQYPWVISSVPMSHIISTLESYPQYPWVISSVPLSHILSTHESYPSTHESYHQYPWVISSVPVSPIISTHESYPQYLWGYAVPMRVCSTCELYLQYLWGYVVHVRICSTREDMQYLWVILDIFEQASEIKCPKFVAKNTGMIQKLSLLSVHLRKSLTVLKGLKVKTKNQPAL